MTYIPAILRAATIRVARIEAGQKVWPVKGVRNDARRIWCVKPVVLTRSIDVQSFDDLPDNPKFSLFKAKNVDQLRFVIAKFETPIQDSADTGDVMTYGFVFDLSKSNAQLIESSIPATEHSAVMARLHALKASTILPVDSYKLTHRKEYDAIQSLKRVYPTGS